MGVLVAVVVAVAVAVAVTVDVGVTVGRPAVPETVGVVPGVDDAGVGGCGWFEGMEDAPRVGCTWSPVVIIGAPDLGGATRAPAATHAAAASQIPAFAIAYPPQAVASAY